MADDSQAIHALEIPPALERELAARGLTRPELRVSDVALCLSASVPGLDSWPAPEADVFRTIALAAASIRQAALQIELDLPLVVVLDLELPGHDSEIYGPVRKVFDRWASDQDWHRGNFAIYLCPPVLDPAGSGWTGSVNRQGMVQHLLGPGAADWHLAPMDRPTITRVAADIERWARDRDLDRSGPHCELLQAAATALRGLDVARRRGEALVAAQEILDRVVDDWLARHLAESSAGLDEGLA